MTPLLLPRAGLVRAGLLAYYDFSRRNLLRYSEDLTAPAWSATLTTVTANQSLSPGGGNTADRVAISAAASYVQQGFNFGAGSYTFSIWLRSTLGGTETVRLRIFDGLLASVTPPGDSCVDGEGFEDMLARRSQELRDGTVKAYSIDETIAAMRESLAKRSQS